MGFSHHASTVLGCEIDHKLIDPAKLKANWKQNDNLEDDDDTNSMGSSRGEMLEFAQTFIQENFKHLCLEWGNVYELRSMAIVLFRWFHKSRQETDKLCFES
jgi:hypothetical protein